MHLKYDKKSTFLLNQILKIKGARELSRLRWASRFPGFVQEQTLRNILEESQDTVYGREHHFDLILKADRGRDLIRRFRHYCKPTEFEDYRPLVERMKSGEENVLFKGKPAVYGTTSGSTGQPKFIPVSKKYIDEVYRNINILWLDSFRKANVKAFSGYIFAVAGKTVESLAPDGTVCGSVSGFTNANMPRIISERYAIPRILYDIEDYASRNYALMRVAIEHNVTVWVAPNPSTIVEFQNTVDRWLDTMIDDIGSGTLCKDFDIPEEIRRAVEPMLLPNRARAFELRALQSQYERVLPRHYWPNLKILNTWKCGNTSIYLKKMSDFFRYDLVHLELGYFSTECRFGAVLDDSIETVLMPHMHFYEFKKEKDLDKPDAPFYLLNELKEGERYCPFITTASGLYRYNMNDIVQASSPFANTPRVHMVQKVNGIVSITGEKLYETQFIRAVDMAQESTGMKLSYYAGYVNLSESRYDWYFEFADWKIKQKQADKFAELVDTNLKSLNIEYESKRNSFRLKDPAVYLLQHNAFDKFKEYILNRSHRDASRFKPNVLAQNESNHSVIHRLRQNSDEIRPDSD